MTIEPLHWDSKHFNNRIGAVHVSHLTPQGYTSILTQKEQFDLVYVFSNSYDQTLAKPINTKQYFLAHYSDLKSYALDEITPITSDYFNEVFNLSIVAGQFSRFKLDPNFNSSAFHSLYTKWVEKSFSENHLVFGYIKDKQLLGMISLNFLPLKNVANIELIGVDPKAQGKQIGSKLISACMNHVKQHSNINYLSVQTQQENTLACKFYLKCGFKAHNFINIHHIWTL